MNLKAVGPVVSPGQTTMWHTKLWVSSGESLISLMSLNVFGRPPMVLRLRLRGVLVGAGGAKDVQGSRPGVPDRLAECALASGGLRRRAACSACRKWARFTI